MSTKYTAMLVSYPVELHPDTAELVLCFAEAMAMKLLRAQQRHGTSIEWQNAGLRQPIQEAFKEHVIKGDPIDVANYCAFMWHHGWPTSTELESRPPREQPQPWALELNQWQTAEDQ